MPQYLLERKHLNFPLFPLLQLYHGKPYCYAEFVITQAGHTLSQLRDFAHKEIIPSLWEVPLTHLPAWKNCFYLLRYHWMHSLPWHGPQVPASECSLPMPVPLALPTHFILSLTILLLNCPHVYLPKWTEIHQGSLTHLLSPVNQYSVWSIRGTK